MQRREEETQVRRSREQGGSKSHRERSMKTSEEGGRGTDRNHRPCDHGNETFIYNETLLSRELLVHERGRDSNKVNHIS